MKRFATILGMLGVLGWAGAAQAETKILKVDQFPADIAAAATAIGGMPLATQPGWAQGEAFGQMYRPAAADFPIKILGLEMILAAPPNAPTLTAPARIEIWLSDSDTADPGKAEPDFSISTADLFNPQTAKLGMPLVGNTAYSVEFDWSTAEGHPPMVTQGTIRAVVRYTDGSQDLQSQWGTYQCSQMLGMCGCQNVGVLLDQTTTKKANLMHLVTPLGQCSGGKAWKFMEDVGVTGDVILRLKVETAGGGCTAACDGKQCGDDGCGGQCGTCATGKVCVAGVCQDKPCDRACVNGSGQVLRECGDDGCGGSCGTCVAGTTCQDFHCVAGLSLMSVTPAFGYADTPTPIAVQGTGFVTGLTARIAALKLTDVVVDGATLFRGTVPNLLDPGTYDLSVANPDGTTATLAKAFEVRARPVDTADATGEDAATADLGPADAGADVPSTGADVGGVDVAAGGKGGSGGGCAAGTADGAGTAGMLLLLGAMAWLVARGRRWA